MKIKKIFKFGNGEKSIAVSGRNFLVYGKWFLLDLGNVVKYVLLELKMGLD